VLFSTSDPLLAGDVDAGGRDTYDARVDGGFSLPLAGPACSLESCESAVGISPSLATAGSARASGEPLVSKTNMPERKKAAPKKKKANKKKSIRLERALRACRGKPRSRRAACEHAVQHRFASANAVLSTRRGGR